MKIIKTLTTSALIALLLVSCAKKEVEFQDPLLTNRDTTVSPSDDFFMYANGGWFKRNPIPESESSNGIFRTIADTINNQIKTICEKSSKNTAAVKGSNEQKIGDFYASGMDTVTIDKVGLKALDKELKAIDAIKDVPSLLTTIGYLHTIGAGPAFSFYVGQDDKISTQYAVFLSQGGLGMGNRDYYFNTDAETVTIRNEYVKHLKAMLQLTGQDPVTAEKDAATIMKLETELAKNSRKLEALRDPIKNYNKMSVAQLSAKTPNIKWENVLPAFGIAKADSVIVGQPEFFTAIDKMVKGYAIADWKTYLK